MAFKRDATGKFERGHAGGPGRPRDGVTNALRRMHDPEEIAAFLLNTIKMPGAKMADRIKCAELVIDRLEGRAVATNVNVSAGAGLPPGWSTMSPSDRVAYLDRIELALPAPAMLSSATDDDAEPGHLDRLELAEGDS